MTSLLPATPTYGSIEPLVCTVENVMTYSVTCWNFWPIAQYSTCCYPIIGMDRSLNFPLSNRNINLRIRACVEKGAWK